ncbi:hypothetical protein BWR18_00105 [Tateyamaria omphalii]|uniref:Uncharacterized protein n=1 Tax=Tateyamaria omphalii TaxID=299262 RepID=A0A1P8MQC7_9RHOB|nr:hypothetical protein BWR18_00105 [Tateyamaria omphalii]
MFNGLDQRSKDALIPELRALVANPIPPDAISISNELPRYRLQVAGLTVGYEFDTQFDVVEVKVILPDSSRETDDGLMLRLMRGLSVD